MIGEREDISNENEYGALNMRPYVIDGNEINAFYDDNDNLVFVLDNTINQTKPNVLLVINPSGDKKWDEILSGQYGVDLETIRPKQDNKYQKLDIEYSGLSVYENLINALVSGEDLGEYLVQLNILRDSAARHSAMTRLNVANETITKTNATIVRTKEAIIRLQNRVKTLRAKLSAAKKEIGKVSTKQSAAKILKLESQIEATNEKLKRAQKRLESAQKRLEAATVDAELASDLLNQPALDISDTEKVKPVMVAPKYEVQTTEDEEEEDKDADDDEDVEEDEENYDDNDEDLNNDVKPLFDENPNNLNEDIAFKPISFDVPAVPVTNVQDEQPAPVFTPTPMFEDSEEETETEEFEAPDMTSISEQRPVLESMTPVDNVVEENKPVLESMTPVAEPVTEQQPIDVRPVEAPAPVNNEPAAPVAPVAQNPVVPPAVPPVVNTYNADVSPTTSRSKPTFIYYLLLVVLIVLSVFTLWLYQKNMGTSEPLLTANVEATEKSQPKLTERLKVVKNKVKEKAEAVVAEMKKPVETPVKEEPAEEYEFADDEPEEVAVATEEVSVTTPEEAPQPEEIVETPEEPVDVATEDDAGNAPEIMDAVPAQVMTSGNVESEKDESEENKPAEEITEADVDKPVYEVGPKHDDMIVSEQDYEEPAVAGEDSVEPDAEEEYLDEEESYEE